MADPILIFVQEGFTVDYTPDADMAAGDVIDAGAFIATSLVPIPASTVGSLVTYQGPVFDGLKFTGEAIALWAPVYWDAGTGTVTGTIGYSEARIGHCMKAALAGDTRVRFKISPPIT